MCYTKLLAMVRKNVYKEGCRVMMPEPKRTSIPVNMEGIVQYVDDNGTIYIKFSNGYSTGIAIEDGFCSKVYGTSSG